MANWRFILNISGLHSDCFQKSQKIWSRRHCNRWNVPRQAIATYWSQYQSWNQRAYLGSRLAERMHYGGWDLIRFKKPVGFEKFYPNAPGHLVTRKEYQISLQYRSVSTRIYSDDHQISSIFRMSAPQSISLDSIRSILQSWPQVTIGVMACWRCLGICQWYKCTCRVYLA